MGCLPPTFVSMMHSGVNDVQKIEQLARGTKSSENYFLTQHPAC
jgi:hypothetical protein